MESALNTTAAPGIEWVGRQVFLCIVFTTMMTVAVFGNFLVISSVILFRKLQTVTNYFIVSLACADLLVSLIVMPCNAIFTLLGTWPFGLFFCDMYQSIDILACTASILNLSVISLDRYWAITSPFTYYQKVNGKSAFLLIGGVWIVSFLISVLPVMLNWHEDEELAKINWYNDSSLCVLAMNATFGIVSSTISFYLPAMVIIFTYTQIFIVARRQARQIAAHNNAAIRIQQQQLQQKRGQKHSAARERKAAKTLGIIMGVFIASWLPFFVANIIDPLCSRCIEPVIFETFVWLGFFNSAANPLIYAQNVSFRNAFRGIIFCHKCRNIPYREGDTTDEQMATTNNNRDGIGRRNPSQSTNVPEIRTVSESIQGPYNGSNGVPPVKEVNKISV